MSDILLDGIIHRPYLPGGTDHPNEQCRAVLECVRRQDAVRIALFGGYPSEVMFIFTEGGEQDLVAVASVDGRCEPHLSLMTPGEYLANHNMQERNDVA
jgi:hypothetical protein